MVVREPEPAGLPSILVVDDDEDSREMYVAFLEILGWVGVTAKDAASAIDAATTLRPSAIIMDLGLPGMDGWEATRILKSAAGTRDIPILALTAHAEASYRQQASEAGCDLFITKPCSPRELARHICGALRIAIPPGAVEN